MRLVEEFMSLQGEGVDAGVPAYFVRLAGCNVKCPFCDTKRSWDDGRTYEADVNDIAERIINHMHNENLLVITGGEPFLQSEELVKLLDIVYQNCTCVQTRIETSASYSPDNWWPAWNARPIWISNIKLNVSPKAYAENTYYDFWARFQVNEFRFLVGPDNGENKQTIQWVNRFLNHNPEIWYDMPRKNVILSPMLPNDNPNNWVSSDMMWIKEVRDYCIENGFRFSIQQHKLLGYR